jgi:hypothetical protein
VENETSNLEDAVLKILDVKNVCEALPIGLEHLRTYGKWEETRAGRALVAPTPVTVVYNRPRERVLFSALRDANPFFHCCEAVLWMLAGRRDAAFLDNFVKDFGERFAEPSGEIHDAYGYRWRHAFGFDQIEAVIKQLSNSPGSRQAVLTMWDPRNQDDLRGTWRTKPCNTHAYLRIHNGELNITVCNRSNDLCWGLAGSNSVTFSILQEYLAARLDVGVGTYYQTTNNLHIYEDQYNKLTASSEYKLWDDRYTSEQVEPMPLVHDVECFDEEVGILLELYENNKDLQSFSIDLENKFLSKTMWPMLMAHRAYKNKDKQGACKWASSVEAADWKVATVEWIVRKLYK